MSLEKPASHSKKPKSHRLHKSLEEAAKTRNEKMTALGLAGVATGVGLSFAWDKPDQSIPFGAVGGIGGAVIGMAMSKNKKDEPSPPTTPAQAEQPSNQTKAQKGGKKKKKKAAEAVAPAIAHDTDLGSHLGTVHADAFSQGGLSSFNLHISDTALTLVDESFSITFEKETARVIETSSMDFNVKLMNKDFDVVTVMCQTELQTESIRGFIKSDDRGIEFGSLEIEKQDTSADPLKRVQADMFVKDTGVTLTMHGKHHLFINLHSRINGITGRDVEITKAGEVEVLVVAHCRTDEQVEALRAFLPDPRGKRFGSVYIQQGSSESQHKYEFRIFETLKKTELTLMKSYKDAHPLVMPSKQFSYVSVNDRVVEIAQTGKTEHLKITCQYQSQADDIVRILT